MIEKIMQIKNGINLLQSRCLPGDVNIRRMLEQMDEAMSTIENKFWDMDSRLKLAEIQSETQK